MKPAASSALLAPKWERLSRRVESLVIAAAPADVREELVACRTRGLLELLGRLFALYAPGGTAEWESALKGLQSPAVASSVQECLEGLRKWKRWLHRLEGIGGTTPDASLLQKGLKALSKPLLDQSEAAFRLNLVKSSLKLDTLPTYESVMQYHAHLVSEAEFASRRLPKAQVNQLEGESAPGGKGSRNPQAQAKSDTPPIENTTPGGGDSPEKKLKPCKQGCRRGDACSFEHKWSNIPAEERADRCRKCGGKGHRKADCPYGPRADPTQGSPAVSNRCKAATSTRCCPWQGSGIPSCSGR